MSDFNNVWRRYNLLENPYFQKPLTIEDRRVPISAFVGRDEEVNKLIQLMASGNERILIIGDSGIGKTSLVNFVRSKARDSSFFSPMAEIEINYAMTGQEFCIATLNSLYREIKIQGIILSSETMSDLENMYNLGKLLDGSDKNTPLLNFERLRELFKRTVKEIVNPRYKSIILHYDNLDNIEEIEQIPLMFGEIRDLLLTEKVTFIFVGNLFLVDDIGFKPRVRQIFYFPPIEIKGLSLEEVKRLLEERIKFLSMSENLEPEKPHTNEALKSLFELYDGNIRYILQSLSACVLELARTNNPVKLTDSLMRDVLIKKVKKEFIDGLTQVEKEIIDKMLSYKERITPTELASITGKAVQNISSFYLPKLRRKTTVDIVAKEGRNVYYEVRPEVKWLKLEQKKEIKWDKEENKIKKFIGDKLTDYI